MRSTFLIGYLSARAGMVVCRMTVMESEKNTIHTNTLSASRRHSQREVYTSPNGKDV